MSNGKLIGESASSPYSFVWDRVPRERHRVSAVAVLAGGDRIASTLDPCFIAAPSAGGKAAALPAIIEPVSAAATSVEEPRYKPSLAMDGSVLTRWSSAFKDGQSLTLDLGYPREVCGLSLFWEKAYAREYSIDLSLDGQAWETAVLRPDGAGGEENVEVGPRLARYVRMQGRKRATEWGFSLWEMIVHGD